MFFDKRKKRQIMIYETEFRAYLKTLLRLDGTPLVIQHTIDKHVEKNKAVAIRISRGLGIVVDIDAEFERDGLVSLMARFDDAPENAATLSETTRFMGISETTSSASSYQSSIRRYKVFREKRLIKNRNIIMVTLLALVMVVLFGWITQ